MPHINLTDIGSSLLTNDLECDVIRIFKLCTEEQGISRVPLCILKMRIMLHQVQQHEHIKLSYLRSVLQCNTLN